MSSSVAAKSFWSCTLAPSTAAPIGTPRPSINTERLTPSLPRSVGFFPVFFPTQRRLVHRPVQTLPLPVDPLQFVVFFQREAPQLLKHTELHPFLKVGVDCASRSELTGHGLPLTSSSQDVQNSVHDVPQRQPRTPAFTTPFVNW